MANISPNSNISHYRILSKLGAGGMGEVYLAQDTKLDRKVALKILPADVASNRDRMERFVREAKSAAALNHPNIAHVYEIGESDSMHYIAMEFIDGVTLREKIYNGETSLPKLLKYLTQVAEGLNKAHAAGIVHRDLKPDNIMITRDDYAKVLDFGLAKLIEPQKGFGSSQSGSSEVVTALMQQQSIAGMVMGTIGYMSPEQASGRVHEIDHRSDIFSFGCILFEAATGQKAFEGKDALDSLHKIVHAPTPLLKDVNPLAPDDLQRVVRRCLSKEADKRYQSMREVAIEIDDLQEVLKNRAGIEYANQPTSATSATSSEAKRSVEGFWVAVLPFKHQGSLPELEALTEGINEGIISGLSRFPYLKVIARGSAARLSSESGDIRTIGKELGARYLMEGSIRQASATVRLAVQLVDAVTGAHLWAENYNRNLKESDIFTVQDDLTDRVVATVADSYGVLVRSMAASVEEKPETELTASDWVLRQYRYRQLLTPEEHAKVRNGLESFVEREPKHAAPWACLAQLYVDEFVFKFNPRPGALDRALAAARRSVDLDRAFQYGNQILAQVHFFRRDIPAFRTAAERAMALNSRDTDTLAMMGLMLVHIAEFDRGANVVRRAMDLNPNHAGWYHFAVIWEHLHKGDYEKALARVTRVNMPGLFWQPLAVACCCGLLGRLSEAAAAVRELHKLDPEFELHAREYIECWHYSSGLMDRILEGLSKAGLEIAADPATPFSLPAGVPSVNQTVSAQSRIDEGFWIAVLPFKAGGSNLEVTTLAEGLSEEIATGLSRFSYLRVVARTHQIESESANVQTLGKKLGARYILEGSLRQAGSTLRLSVQLVDTTTGAHLWAETYNRAFNPEAVFELQDDLVPRIVAIIADMHGVLTRSMSEALRGRTPEQLTPYEAVLRSFGFFERVNPEELTVARAALELAVRRAPTYADAWAMLALICVMDYAEGFNLQADSLAKGALAAQRAVEAGPSNNLAYSSLAQALFFQKEFLSFRNAAERAIALNPMDASVLAFLGVTLAYVGEWERGCALAERAMQLNPNHPGWYRYAAFFNAYRQEHYREALDVAIKIMPRYFWSHVVVAVAAGQLGDLETARTALREILAEKPDFGRNAREEFLKWNDPELVEHVLDGLRKAGLKIPEEASSSIVPSSASSPSSEMRSDEGFWVAVLPFKASGSNLEVSTLAEGFLEEIVTGLSRFSYLRVIARASTLRYSNEAGDIRNIGKELGARYVLEGSLRQAGSNLRLSVQLVDANSGAHLWAETYNRPFSPDALFELQDELVPRIVSTIADLHGVLPHSMSEAVRLKPLEQLSPYEAVLRSFGYSERVTPAALQDALACLELASQKAPNNADVLGMLASLYTQDYGQGFNLRTEPLLKAETVAQKAVEIAPSNHLAWFALAQVHFFKKEFQLLLNAAERAVALNSMDGHSMASLGELLSFSGNWSRGTELVERAKQLNPNHPGWYWYVDFHRAYEQHDYQNALTFALKVNLPGHWISHGILAASYGQLGQRDSAARALKDMLRLRPEVRSTLRETMQKWWTPEVLEHFSDGLRKAGFEFAAEERVSTLSGTTTISAVDSPPAIAVLPFENLSPDPDNEFFADGLTEEVISDLSGICSLRVISRTSVMPFKGSDKSLRAVADELNVRYVLEGSVRRAGANLRITAQLIDAQTDSHLWVEKYSGNIEDVFAIQEEISRKIVNALHLRLTDAEAEAIAERPIDNAAAYDCYMRARHEVYRFTAAGLDRAQKLVDAGLSLIGENSLLLATRGMVSWYYLNFSIRPEKKYLDEAAIYVARALELDPRNYFAIFLRGLVASKRGDIEGALADIQAAHQQKPGDAMVVNELIRHFFTSGQEHSELTRPVFEESLRVDPLHPLNWAQAAWRHFTAGRLTESVEATRQVLHLADRGHPARVYAGYYLVLANLREEAIRVLTEEADVQANTPYGSLSQFLIAALKQDAEGAISHVTPQLEQAATWTEYLALVLADGYSLIGHHDAALRWYRAAVDQGFINYPYLATHDPLLANVRSDPRFAELMREIKPRWEALSKTLS